MIVIVVVMRVTGVVVGFVPKRGTQRVSCVVLVMIHGGMQVRRIDRGLAVLPMMPIVTTMQSTQVCQLAQP